MSSMAGSMTTWRKADAVFAGGGVKVIGLVGALSVAEENGYRWVNVAGTSAGAIVAALVAAGYRADEIARIIRGMDFTVFRDPPPWGHIPLIGPLLSLVVLKGLYLGDALERWLYEHLEAKGIYTFGDLRMTEAMSPGRTGDPFRYRLQVIAADISRGRMLVLPRDAGEYGLDPDRLGIAAAVRMSAAIPFYYRPGTLRWGPRRERCYIVDGGLLSNFPVWLFDVPGRPRWPTFGFHFCNPQALRPRRIHGPLTLAAAIMSTMLEAHDALWLEEADFARTIAIPTMGVGTTEFDISPERAEQLYQAGVRAAQKFFQKWDFSSYVAQYRNQPPSGRLTAAESS